MLFKLLLGACLIAVTVFSGIMVVTALDMQDKADCITWQIEAQQYPLFKLTQDEADQCKYWNITVDAPIYGTD